jgi:hypothetical protein
MRCSRCASYSSYCNSDKVRARESHGASEIIQRNLNRNLPSVTHLRVVLVQLLRRQRLDGCISDELGIEGGTLR